MRMHTSSPTHVGKYTMSSASSGGSAVKSKQGKIVLGGKELDVVCSLFKGRIFLFISELEKMGTLLDVRQEMVPAKSTRTFSVATLLGIDTPEVHVFGRAIAGHLLPPNHRLLLALGLREPTPHLIPQLLPLLEDYKLWIQATQTAVTT